MDLAGRNILLDGINLEDRQGTGCKVHARSLIQALKQLGAQPHVLTSSFSQLEDPVIGSDVFALFHAPTHKPWQRLNPALAQQGLLGVPSVASASQRLQSRAATAQWLRLFNFQEQPMQRNLGRTLLAALLVSTCVSAQEQTHPLAGLEGPQESLLGDQLFGMYIGNECIGQFSVGVQPATSRPDATYTVVSTAAMSFGPMQQNLRQTDQLDAQLSVLHSLSLEEEAAGEEATTTKKEVRLEGTSWILEQSIDGEETRHSIEFAGAVYDDPAAFLLVAMMLPLDGEFTGTELASLNWPDDDEPDKVAAYGVTTVEVGPWTEFDLRGEMVQVRELVFSKEGGNGPMNVAVTAEHKVVAFWPANAPIRVIAGSAEEVMANLPEEAAGDPQPVDNPKEAAVVYFKVLGKLEELGRLDDVMDWEASAATLAAEDPNAQMTGAQLRSVMRAQFEAAVAPFTKEQLDATLLMLEEKIDGDDARVWIKTNPGAAFELRKAEDGWRIVNFPH